jgi:ABC-type glycerol-3-phosphate transport system permease component
MYEHKKQKLAPVSVYYKRIRNSVLIAFCILVICLLMGAVGYKLTIQEFDWYDSFLNASMILSGMGPMIDPQIILTKPAKIFATAYALFSGVAFLSTFSLLIAPIVHRFFHKIHVEDPDVK